MVAIAESVPKPDSHFRFILDRRDVLGSLFVAPAILYVLLLVGVPFLMAVYYSLSAYTIYDPSWMFDSLYSVINWTFIALGFVTREEAPNWLGSPNLALLSVTIVNAWRFFPFAIVIFLAGITAIPQDVLDAATVDGAGFWRRNYQIILPMLLPIMTIGLVFGVVFTFTDLSIVFLMTMGGPVGATSVLGFAGFQTGITSGDVSHGAAISLFMLPVLLIVVVAMLRFIRRREI